MSTNKSFSAETSERYSRALFEVLKEANELEKTEADIKNLMFLLKNRVLNILTCAVFFSFFYVAITEKTRHIYLNQAEILITFL